MKALILSLSLLMSSVAFADQNLDAKIDGLIKSIVDVRIVVNKNYEKSPEEVKALVCAKLVDVHVASYALQQEALNDSTLPKRYQNASVKILNESVHALSFCGPQENVDPNLKLYNVADVLNVLEQMGGLALMMKSED